MEEYTKHKLKCKHLPQYGENTCSFACMATKHEHGVSSHQIPRPILVTLCMNYLLQPISPECTACVFMGEVSARFLCSDWLVVFLLQMSHAQIMQGGSRILPPRTVQGIQLAFTKRTSILGHEPSAPVLRNIY